MPKLSYKFLLFDLDHTLLDFDVAEDEALTSLLIEEGISAIDDFKAYYRPMNKQMWRDLEKGLISKADLVNTRFAKLFAHFGIEMDGVYLAERYALHLSQQGQTYAGAVDVLTELKAHGYLIYGATNGVTSIQRGRMVHSGLNPLFERVFISEAIGKPKPHRAFYDYIAEQIPDFACDKALMIGDSLTADVMGANHVGMDSVWYNPNHLDNKTEAVPTYTVSSYEDLLALLISKG